MIEKIKAAGFEIELDGDGFFISPSDKLTDKQRQWLKSNKPKIIACLAAKRATRAVVSFELINGQGSGIVIGESDDTAETLIEVLRQKYGNRLMQTGF